LTSTLRELLSRSLEFLKRNLLTLYYAMKHPRTPWPAKLMAGLVIGYAVSPIDLIPDFIPVIGYLDDLLLLPLGIWLVFKLTPVAVIDECRELAQNNPLSLKPAFNLATVVIVLFWLLAFYGVYLFFAR